MTVVLTDQETWLLQACVAADDAVAARGWEQWAAWWQDRFPDGWAAAPHHQLALVVPAYWRLKAAGLDIGPRELVSGLVRATWSLTAMHLGLAMPHIDVLMTQVDTMVIKGAALCAAGLPFGHRRISDVDVVVHRADLPKALETLSGLGYSPLYGATFASVDRRLAARRDGWNFGHPSGAQVDLHWRFFDVAGEESSADARVWQTDVRGTLLGREVRVPPPAFCAAFSTYHATTRGTPRDRLQNLVDLAHLLSQCTVDEVLTWADRGGVEVETGERLQVLHDLGGPPSASGIVGWTPRYPTPPPPPWEQERSADRPLGTLRQRRASRFPAVGRDDALCERPREYRLWEAVGRPAWLERLLLRRGPMSRTVVAPGGASFDFSRAEELDAVAGPGWAWTAPGEQGTWTDRADARLLVRVPAGARGQVALELAGSWSRPFHLDGDFSTNPRGVIHVDGREVARYDVWDPTQPNPIVLPFQARPGRDWIEISVRPATSPDPRTLAPVYEGWKRSLCVGSVRVTLAP